MSLDHFKVFNLIEDVSALKVLMILESPHIHEYIHGHPAAGESALELTQWLKSQGYLANFNNQLPVGCNIKNLNYKPLGILNCSTSPMNPTFYPCMLADDELAQVTHLLDIKNSLSQSNLQNTALNMSESEVFKDFVIRLTQVLEQAASDIIVVPCGDTAIGFIEVFKSSYNQPRTVLDGLPHPTEPEWHDEINTISLTNHIVQALLP